MQLVAPTSTDERIALAAGHTELIIHEVDGDPIDDLRGRTVPADDPALARVLTDGLPTTVSDVRALFRAPDDASATSAAPEATA